MIKKHLIYLLLIALVGSFLIAAIFHSGWYSSHDGVYHILRTEESLRMLKLGQFPLRWAGTLDNGFGIPLFNFIYPLPYYFSATFSLLVGSVWAVKIVIILSYLLGGYGIYCLFGAKNPRLGLALALLYLMTPYQYLNIFVRGALGEVVAMGLLPWVLVVFYRLSSPHARLEWYDPLPLALLLLAHNFLGILFATFVIGYAIFQKQGKRQIFLSILASFGLATFFLLPMIIERSNLYSLDRQTFTFRFDQHFIYLRQFLYSKWDYWYSLPGPDDGMSFQLGFSQIALSFLGIISVVFTRKRSLSSLYLVIAYLGCIFLMTSHSFFIWDRISILQTIQFPWRLLFMTAILSPLLGSLFLTRIKSPKLQTIFLLALVILSFWNIRNYRRPMTQLSGNEYTDLYRLNLGKTTTTFRTEILPKWSVPNERYKSDELLVNSGNMTIESLRTDPLSLTVTLNNKPDASPARVTILRNFYPGWHLTTEGKETIPLSATDEGMVRFTPLLGIHTYTLQMENTLLERLANAISLLALVSIGGLWLQSRLRPRSTR